FDVVRINAEFFDQTSDHDPLLARFAIPLNDPPVASDDSATVAEDNSVIIDVLANDSDPDHDALAVSAINGQAFDASGHVAVANGTVALNGDGTLTFTPSADFNGAISFDYTVTDGKLSDTATAHVTVTPVDDAPRFTSPTAFATPEDQTTVGLIAAVDPEHDTFMFALAGGSDQAFFSINASTGALRFLTAPDFETLEDADHDNVYDLVVSARDVFGATSTQAISVSVSDLSEPGQTINGGNGTNVLTGTPGNDVINGGNGNDSLAGADGNDNISGGNGNDTLQGGRGKDNLRGNNGNDLVDGGRGDDRLTGGAGPDALL